MARRICELCKFRSVGTGPMSYDDRSYAIDKGWCGPCTDESQHDIEHDNGHQGIPTEECWHCHPELNRASDRTPARKGHTNTVAKTRGSHAGCTHERTPAGRAACRKTRIKMGSEVWTDHQYNVRVEKDDQPTPVRVKKTKKIVVTDASQLPMPKLTATQLASPTIQSMM